MDKIIEIGPDMIRFILLWWVAPAIAFAGIWLLCEGIE